MDTPDKNQITAAPLSNFEDSPVFNYINNLSPIEPVKSMHNGQSFNLLSFTSPSSVFASPHISSVRESRFLPKSNQSPDQLKSVHPPLCGNENKPSEGESEVAQLSDRCAKPLECLLPKSSGREVISELLDEPFGLDFELSEKMKGDDHSPGNNRVSCDVTETSKKPEMVGAPSFSQTNDDVLRATQYFEKKINLRKILRIEQSEEVGEHDWSSLISDVSVLLNSNPSIVEHNSDEQEPITVDPGMMSFMSTVLHPPHDNSNDLEKMVCRSPSSSGKQREMREPEPEIGELGELKDLDQTPDFLSSTLLNKLVVSDSRTEVDDEGEKCCQHSFKRQHKIRRRCLVFELAGGLKKQASNESGCSFSLQSQSDQKDANVGKQLVPGKRERGYSSSKLPGVGLHLNSLATTSKNGKIVKCQTLPSGRQLISMQISKSYVDSMTSSQNFNEFSTLNSKERDTIPCEHDSMVMENAPQTYPSVNSEEFDHSNHKRRRCKPEPADESKACKRCNCKRSKCLKLYCECFAAGLYCVEPCSCLDCFNKPIHEETVMDTRRQIESRNPLAFAPKVIRSNDSVTEYGDEINKTPASARHKRGCNCKKSSCLKKYCECFQGGVGCSISCRCEGCKNAFGRKDGAEETEYEREESEACEKYELDTNSNENVVKNSKEEYPDFQMMPSDVSRGKLSGSFLSAFGPSPKLSTSIKLQTSDLLLQPKFEAHLQVIPEEETPKILESHCSPTTGMHLQSAFPSSKGILSPYHETGSSTHRSRTRRLSLRSALSFPSAGPLRNQSFSRETPIV